MPPSNKRKRDSEDLDCSNSKASDDEIVQNWGQISNEILRLSHQVLTRDPNLSGNIFAPKDVKALIEDYNKLPPLLRPYRIQSLIWDRIYKDVFRGCEKFWRSAAGKKYTDFVHTLSTIRPAYREAFSFIKSCASSLIDEAFSEQESDLKHNIRCIAREWREELDPFIDPSKRGEFLQRVEEVLDRSVNLQRIFIKSRACFIVKKVPRTTFDVDSSGMDVRYRYENLDFGRRAIHIRISPMVKKISSADGHNFKHRVILCKAAVTVHMVKLVKYRPFID